eukprot:Seg1782.10 transcript_id=Seg1782.10/GoldUCD/mRNA.D3Y31 product="Gamma-glutamyl hydrolase" protein_id=Seg1782.10/GoldUCD/D3Y31
MFATGVRAASLLFVIMTVSQEAAVCSARPACRTERPIIGIVAQGLFDSNPVVKHYPWTKGKSYIPASYVKLAESSGARVVPIKDTLTDSELTTLLGSLNGVIFPGGTHSLSTSNYSKTATKIFNYAITAQEKKDYFPVLGLCWGLQMLLKIVAGENPIQRTYSTHIDLKVQFTVAAAKSILFKHLPSTLESEMTNQAITYNNHNWGLHVETYDSNPKIKEFFNLLALSVDLKGIAFGAAFEAKDYPIFGLQWHPEKPLFEWKKELNIDHSFPSLAASQYIANIFRKETSQSCHNFESSSEEDKALIYNLQPINSAVAGSSFEQVYVL